MPPSPPLSTSSSNTLPVIPSASLSPTLQGEANTKDGFDSASPLDTTSNMETTTTTTTKRKYNLTPTEQQALQLQKLLSKPDREIKLPKPLREKELRAPREMIKNVSGSSAGAGSGEFHVYKHSRRREYERIKLMEDKDKREKEMKEYEEKQKSMQEQVDAKTSKNRAKRDKKKNAKLAARGGAPVSGGTAENGNMEQGQGEHSEEDGQAKRKRINAQGTAQIVFRKKGEESDEDDE